jgi:hypothetical protein
MAVAASKEASAWPRPACHAAEPHRVPDIVLVRLAGSLTVERSSYIVSEVTARNCSTAREAAPSSCPVLPGRAVGKFS